MYNYSIRDKELIFIPKSAGLRMFFLILPIIIGLCLLFPGAAVYAADEPSEITAYEENNAALVYSGSWDRPWDSRASGSYYERSATKDSTVHMDFYGTGIKWVAPIGSDFGIAEVRIDGKVEVAELDLYNPVFASQQVVFLKNHLDIGNHSLDIRVTGNHSSSSSGSYVCVDNLKVINSTDAEPPATPQTPDIYGSNVTANLYWHANTEQDFEGYNIYRSVSETSGFQKINEWLQMYGSSYTDTGIKNGTTYYYRITAVDTKGNESNPTQAVSVLPAMYAGTYEDENAGITYTGTWERNWDGSASGSYYKRSKTADNSFNIAFYGTSVKWAGYKDRYSGKAEVTLDNGTAETVDLYYNGNTLYKQSIYEQNGLAEGLHTLNIKVLGTRTTGSNDNWVNIDNIQVDGTTLSKERVQENAISIEYTGLWDSGNDGSYSGGRGTWNTRTGTTVTYTFYGTGIEWISTVNSDRGIAKVTLDNETPSLIDQYNPGVIYQKSIYKRYGLPLGKHTLKLENTGTKSASSSNYYIVIDAFDVIDAVNTVPSAPTGLTAAAGQGSITLNWAAPGPEVTGYRVYRYRGIIDEGMISQSLVRELSYTDKDLIPGVQYTYRVTAVGALGSESGLSDAASVSADAAGTGVSAPSGVTVLAPNTTVKPRYEEEETGIVYSSGWDRPWDGSASGSYYRRTDNEGATVEINFTGTGIRWTALRNNGSGPAEVYVDGRLDSIVSLYNSSTEFQQVVYQKTQLADGYHTLKIRCVGRGYITLDNIVVLSDTDNTAPEAPVGLTLTRDNTKMNIVWTANTESDIDGYRIYRSTSADSGYTAISSKALNVIKGTTQYTDTGLANGVRYYYVITAIDRNGNESEPSVAMNEVPAAGVGIHQENDIGMVYTGSWDRPWDGLASGSYYQRSDASGETATMYFDGTGVKWYSIGYTDRGIAEVYIDDQLAGTVDLYRPQAEYNCLVWQNSGPLSPGVHSITIKNTGNTSHNGHYVIIDYLEVTKSTDTTAPSFPAGLVALRDGTGGPVYLQWNWGQQDEDLYGYYVYRSVTGNDGTFERITPDPIHFGSAYDDTTAPSEAYYRVAAVDTSGNISNQSVTAAVSDATGNYATVEENNSLIQYTGVWSRGSNTNASGGYQNNTSDNNVAIRYTWYGTGIDWLAQVDSASRTVLVKLDDGQPVRVDLFDWNTKYKQPVYRVRNIPLGLHTLEITSMDKNTSSSGNNIHSDAFRVIDAETAAPSAPTEVNAESLVNKVMLTWTPSSDPDVIGYNVYYRYGVYEYRQANLAGPVQSGFRHTGLNLSTMYYYSIKAVDSLGNESGYSEEVSVRTADQLIKAIIVASGDTVVQGTPVTFDGSGSYTADPPLTYQWDLQNDLAYDDGTGATLTHSFEDIGVYTVGLRVTDSLTRTSTATVTINVIARDTTPPEISATNPANAAVNVPLNTEITVTFSENISEGGTYQGITLKDTANTPVVFEKHITGNVMTIIPNPALSNDKGYVVTIPAHAVKDQAGNELVHDYSFYFNTPDTIAPTAISNNVQDAAGAILKKVVRVVFSENVIKDGSCAAVVFRDEYNRNIAYTGAVSGNTLTINTDTALEYDTDYTVTIPVNAVKDASGNYFNSAFNITFTTAAAVHQINQPYGYWKFDDANLTDYGTGAHNGTVYGNPQRVTGIMGDAYSFDGSDDYAALGNWFTFEKFTISMWIKPAESQNHQYVDIMDNYHNDYENWVIQRNSSDPAGKYEAYGAGVNLTNGNWQHMVWVKDASSSRIYIDGRLVYDEASNAINYPGTQNLFVANWARSGGRYWKGLMDELRIYNYTLSQSEVQTLYYDSRPDTTPPVITGMTPANGLTIGGAGNTRITVYFTEDGITTGTQAKFEYSANGSDWTVIGTPSGPYDAGNGSYYFYADWNLQPVVSGEYSVRCTITDRAGNPSQFTSVYQADRSAPGAPQNLTAGYDSSGIGLNWQAPADSDVSKYFIYRKAGTETGFTKISTTFGRNSTVFSDHNVQTGMTYNYKVTAIDNFNQEGPDSNIAQISVSDDTTRPVVLGIEPLNGTVLGPQAQIVVRAEDNLMLSSILLQYSTNGGTDWIDVQTIQTTGNATFNWNTSALAGDVKVRAIARDLAGNTSDGTPVRTYTVDTQGPAKVTGVNGEPSITSILLRWNDVPDQDFSYFQVERKNVSTGEFVSAGTVNTQLGKNITGLSPNTLYTFRVVAYDIRGNRGIPSDEVTATTLSDTVAPAVTNISPAPAKFTNNISLQGTATDNVGVSTFTFQYSADGRQTWVDIITINPAGSPTTAYVSKNWDISAMPEGSVFVRAIAADAAGNTSNSLGSYVEYVIDHSGPAVPMGFTLNASSGDMTLSWSQGAESDLASYKVYKAVGSDSGYVVKADNVQSLSFRDRDVVPNKTYYYKISAVDSAGNESGLTGPLSGGLLPDTTPPAIISISPANHSTLIANPSISVLASDNYKLALVKLEYKKSSDGDDKWSVIGTKSLDVYSDVVLFTWNTSGLTDGEYDIRASAEDAAGNVSAASYMTYTLNVLPPAKPVLTVTPGGWKISLSWTSGNEADLAGFRLYRSTTAGGPYQKIAETTETTYLDDMLAPDHTYYYVVDALDRYYNSSRSVELAASPLPDDPYPPSAEAGDDQTAVVNTEVSFDGTRSRDNNRIDSYRWDFGDGSASNLAQPKHTYTSAGQYSVTLAVYDPAGNSAEDTAVVTVREPLQVGTLEVRVLDDATGEPVSGASVVIEFPDGTSQKCTTSGYGIANLVTAAGEYKVYAYKTDYIPDMADAQVQLNQKTTATVRLHKGELVVGQLNVRRMTLDEIEAAGINTSAPENQWVYKFEVHLAFNNQPLPSSTFITNSTGIIGTVQPLVIQGPPKTSQTPGGSITTPTTLLAYPVVIPNQAHPEVRPTVAYLVIPGEARWLKEFFEVGLTLENTADPVFVLEDSKAELKLPDGLALAPTHDPQSLTVDLGAIAGQESREVKWIIRGDKKGTYTLEALFNAILTPFGDPVRATFKTSEPFRVWGDDAIKMIVDAQDRADKGYPYHVKFGIQNISDIPVYNAAVELKDDTKQNYIYAPDQELEKMMRELPAGETMWADYWLIPSISGTLDLSKSYVLKTGVNDVQIATEIKSHSVPENYPPTTPVLHQEYNADGTVTLTWDAIDGATGYRIYYIRSDLYMSEQPEMVYEAGPGETAVTLPQPGGPRDYVIMSVTSEGERMKHAITGFAWCDQAGNPVITIDPMEVVVGQSSDLMITVNHHGLPVAQGTVDVGSYISGKILDGNGQARVTITPAAAGGIVVSAYDMNHSFLVSKIIKAVNPADTVPPAVPAGLHATLGEGQAALTWTANLEPDLAGYKVFGSVNGSWTMLASVTQTSYTAQGLTIGSTYSFAIKAFDTNGNESEMCAPVNISLIKNSSVSPEIGSFDKRAGVQRDVQAVVAANGNTLQAIRNGDTVLSSGTDYVSNGNVYTIKKEYLAQQPVGNTILSFDFSAGDDPVLKIIIMDSTPPVVNTVISPSEAVFNKNETNPSDIPVSVTFNGNTLTGIWNGATELVAGRDFSVAQSVYSISKSYLMLQPEGRLSLNFDFSEGEDAVLNIDILAFSYFNMHDANGNPVVLNAPMDSAVDSAGNVYVADYNNNRIVVSDSSGKLLRTYGTQGNGTGQFYKPSGLAVDGSDYIYVADTYNNRIVRFKDVNGNGTLEAAEWQVWGSAAGSGALQFNKPMGLYVRNGKLYVADSYNHRIVTFDVSDVSGTWKTYGTRGTGPVQFGAPDDIAADSQGSMYISDTLNQRIQKLDAEGQFVEQYMTNYPYGIAIDSNDNVFYAERLTGLIKCINNGKAYGGQGSASGLFRNPVGVNIDASGRLWIVDVTTGKIQYVKIVP